MDHYYVLSRFLISRMLTVTKIPYMKAVKIALEVKKYLIDNNNFDVTQATLENILFDVMEGKGFGAEYKKRYKMVHQFHQERRPLIIIVCGAPCTGKSSLAQQLASRFNMPNVLQTDMFYELLRTSNDKPLNGQPLWKRSDLDSNQLVHEFQKECHVVRRSIDGDLVKTIRDGKSIIIEGLHLDPGLYLYEFGRYGIRHLHTRNDSLLPTQMSTAQQDDQVLVEPVNPEPMNPDTDVQQAARLEPDGRGSEMADAPSSHQTHATQDRTTSLLGSMQQMLRSQPVKPTSAATGMLFALQSVANRMSPVLSSYVSWQHTDRYGGQSDDRRRSQDQDRPDSQLSRSPGSEWIGQQLQKALHGLASTVAPRTPPSSTSPTRDTDAHKDTAVVPNKPPLDTQSSTDTDAHHLSAAAQSNLHGTSAEQQATLPSASQRAAQTSSVDVSPDARHVDQPAASQHSSLDVAQSTAAETRSAEGCAEQQHQQAQQQCQQQQQQQQQLQQHAAPGEDAAMPPAAGNANTTAAVEPQRPEGVHDRVPAAVALESPDEPHTHADKTDAHAQAAPQEATDLEQPQTVSQPEQKQEKKSPTPVFVPIVVSMDDRDHKLLVEEWYSRQMAMSGQLSNTAISDQEVTDSANAIYSRIRLLQEHLCTYSERNVPVVQINFANFSDTLDQLHDYLLQCIGSAMQQE